MKAAVYFSQYFETISQGLKSINSAQLENASAMVLEAHQSNKKMATNSSSPEKNKLLPLWEKFNFQLHTYLKGALVQTSISNEAAELPKKLTTTEFT